MGSSEDNINKGIDASVGGLVWVRRRNGSWWPGQILGPEVLPDNCLVSSKSLTPVKLLGRENASVDWYNLEKSKRLKSFRCGEYDECIEKAKAAATNVSKKAVKYARREDAIVHALELESASLSNGHQDLCLKTDLMNPNSSHSHDNSDETADASTLNNESDSVVGLSRSGVSFENPSRLSSLKVESFCVTRRDSDDDDTESGAKRMRGLDDLGLGVASSTKRKRSQVANVHEYLKKKKRQRPLAKVMENTMVTVPIMCEEFDVPTGSFLEYKETKTTPLIVIKNFDSNVVSCENVTLCNESEVENQASGVIECLENGSSDKLFDVPLVAEEDHSVVSPTLSCLSQKSQFITGVKSCQSSKLESVLFKIEEPNEPDYISYKDAEMNCVGQKMEKGTKEWQLKGKRNSRNGGKCKKQEDKSMDINEESDRYLVSTDQNLSSSVKSKSISEIQLKELRGWIRSRNEIRTLRPMARLLPYRQSRFMVNPKYDPLDFSLGHCCIDNSLYNVNVEVQSSSCRPQHVPYISLMSKLSGRPIVGHPITVEVLEDGFCDDLMCRFESCSDIKEEKMTDLPSGIHYESTLSSHHRVLQTPKLRRNGVFLSKKMRKLSSLICTNRKIVEEEEENTKTRIVKFEGPLVACVPLNIVFSRINADFSLSIRPGR